MKAQKITPITLRDALDMAVHDRVLYVILFVFIGLASVWNYTTPIFEAPDEPDHLQYILFVADKWHRPDLRTEAQQAGVESPQPPLYYFIMGVVTRISGIKPSFVHPTRNPSFSFERMDSAPNYFLPSADSYDYVHILRACSAMFGLVTVTCTYLAAALLGADRTLRLTTTAVSAFIPQFTFISGAITNDSLTAALASIGIVWLLYLLHLPSPRAWHSAIFGAISALTFLTKHHTIFLFPFGILMFFLVRAGNWKQILKDTAWSAIGFLGIAGWYLLYNLWQYGDPTAVNMQVQIVPELVARKSLLDQYDIVYFVFYFPRRVFESFLGTFGWMRIFLPGIFYGIYEMAWLGALGGMAYAVFKKKWDRVREGLIAAPLLALAAIIYVNFTFTAPQGRYFFPALDAISLLFVLGLAELTTFLRRPLLIGAPLFLLLTNFYSLWLVSSAFGRG